MNLDNANNEYNIIMLGESGVGNNYFSIRLTSNEFTEQMMVTQPIFRCVDLNINHEQIKVRLWKVPGQEIYRTIALRYAREAVGIILSYKITNRDSFDRLKEILSQVRDNAECNPVFMLMGMQLDREDQRRVKIEEGIQFAQNEYMMFAETSSLSNINVREAVTNLAIEIYNRIDSTSIPFVNYTHETPLPRLQNKKGFKLNDKYLKKPIVIQRKNETSNNQKSDEKMSNDQNQNQLEIIDDKNFIYKNELYPFNFESFKKHSQYFARNQDLFKGQKNINLVNEMDKKTNILPESIRAMIEFSKDKRINFDKLYIPDLLYLANKYKMARLYDKINYKVLVNHKVIIEDIFSNELMNETDVTYIFEDIISKNMKYAIELYEEQLLSLPFHLIYRILQKYRMNKGLNESISNLNEFILKIIKIHGIQMLSLLMKLEIIDMNQELLDKLFFTYFIDTGIHVIDPNLMCIFQEMKKEIRSLRNEVKDLKKEIEYDKNIIFSSIKSITIPSDMTEIPSKYFKGKSHIQEIIILQSITSIGKESFSECISLTSITIPESVKSIDSGCFSGCKSLTQINIMAQLASIESYLFCGCTSLKTIKIPETVTAIDFSAFANCSSLNNVIIPGSVVRIGAECFCGCSSLSKIKILGQIKEISFGLFDHCTALKYIEIPSSVEKIDFSSFTECTSLRQVFFKCNSNKSYSLKEIKENAFENCSDLTTINIPDSATNINQNAFFGCTSLDIGMPGTKNWSYSW